LRILTENFEGALQRAIFECSRRNIAIEKLFYSAAGGSARIEIIMASSDTVRVEKHLKRMSGVKEVEVIEEKGAPGDIDQRAGV